MGRRTNQPCPRSWAEADELLTGRNAWSRKIGNNTTLYRRAASIAVTLHETDVVEWTTDGWVTFRTGGWNSVTTRERLNRYAPPGVSFYTDKRILYVSVRNHERAVTASEGMRLRVDDPAVMEHGPELCEPAPPRRGTHTSPPGYYGYSVPPVNWCPPGRTLPAEREDDRLSGSYSIPADAFTGPGTQTYQANDGDAWRPGDRVYVPQDVPLWTPKRKG